MRLGFALFADQFHFHARAGGQAGDFHAAAGGEIWTKVALIDGVDGGKVAKVGQKHGGLEGASERQPHLMQDRADVFKHLRRLRLDAAFDDLAGGRVGGDHAGEVDRFPADHGGGIGADGPWARWWSESTAS